LKPVFQTRFKGYPRGTQPGPDCGNCLQACVASILELDLEDVPNFAEVEGEHGWWQALQDFVTERGFFLYALDPEHGAPEDTYYLAVGDSPRGDFNHVVVANGTAIVHDPNPTGEGLKGYAKEMFLFVARDPARLKHVVAAPAGEGN
jgi:hypothetical protein